MGRYMPKITLQATALALAVILSGLVSNSAVAQQPDSPITAPKSASESTPCTEHARETLSKEANWVCVGDSLSITEGGKVTHQNVATGKTEDVTGKSAEERAAIDKSTPSGEAVTPFARVDDFHSITNRESIIWHIDDQDGSLRMSYNVVLYNHSGDISIGWAETTGVPVEVQFKLRIREDRGSDFDLDVFEYEHPDNYNPGYASMYYTAYEPSNGVGYDALPYPASPKKYFWDAYDIFIATETSSWVSVWGAPSLTEPPARQEISADSSGRSIRLYWGPRVSRGPQYSRKQNSWDSSAGSPARS